MDFQNYFFFFIFYFLQENTLYWCDARTDRIEKINLETGESREIVLSAANVDLFAVAVFGPYIYWSDR